MPRKIDRMWVWVHDAWYEHDKLGLTCVPWEFQHWWDSARIIGLTGQFDRKIIQYSHKAGLSITRWYPYRGNSRIIYGNWTCSNFRTIALWKISFIYFFIFWKSFYYLDYVSRSIFSNPLVRNYTVPKWKNGRWLDSWCFYVKDYPIIQPMHVNEFLSYLILIIQTRNVYHHYNWVSNDIYA